MRKIIEAIEAANRLTEDEPSLQISVEFIISPSLPESIGWSLSRNGKIINKGSQPITDMRDIVQSLFNETVNHLETG